MPNEPKEYLRTMSANDQIKLAEMAKDVSYTREKVEDIGKKMEDLDKKVDDQFVSKIEFEPIKKIVYGLVGIILTAVVLAVVGLVVIRV